MPEPTLKPSTYFQEFVHFFNWLF